MSKEVDFFPLYVNVFVFIFIFGEAIYTGHFWMYLLLILPVAAITRFFVKARQATIPDEPSDVEEHLTSTDND
jgi:hypothetical protein